MKYVKVVIEHVSAFPEPLNLQRGERVKLGHHSYDWPDWIWGETESGKAGWIPEAFLEIRGKNGKLERDYDSTELNVKVGDRLRVLEEVSGWYWCEAPGGLHGWIPTNKAKE